MAISRPLSLDNLEVVKALLEGGAKAKTRLRYKIPETDEYDYILGPTLLHAILARRPEDEAEEDVSNYS